VAAVSVAEKQKTPAGTHVNFAVCIGKQYFLFFSAL